jgi:hypothetical protein
VIEDYPIIVNELSIPKGFVSKETMVEVRNVTRKKVRGNHTYPTRGQADGGLLLK